MNKKLNFGVKISIVAALGGFLFGYDTAVIAGVLTYLQKRFELSPAMVGWAASSAIWGCLLGVIVAGYWSDRWGRKKVLLLTAVLFFVSSIGSAIPDNLTQFIIARFIGGVGIGAASMLSPLYISEIAPAKNRGMMVSLYQLAIVLGINIIYFVNHEIAALGNESWNVDSGWRYMMASGMAPALLFFVLLFSLPESPRWLIKNNRSQEGLAVLTKINGLDESIKLKSEIESSLHTESGTVQDLVRPGLRRALFIGSFLALFSQITGINAVIYYAPEIFKSIGIGAESALFQTVIIGTVNTIFTFVALLLIDSVGRKKLLIAGTIGIIICLFGTGLCFRFPEILSGEWLLIFILGFIACFAFSLGPIPWVIMGEIFPTKTRGVAMSFATLVLWVGVLLVTHFTPILLEYFGGDYTFWLFASNAIILLIFILYFVRETKHKTLEEIEQSWRH